MQRKQRPEIVKEYIYKNFQVHESINTSFEERSVRSLYEMYSKHIKSNDRSREEKAKDKENNKCVLTMDLQAIKVCPWVQASAIFYKTKLSCHNFTVYNIINKHTTCFWYTELDADMTASTFATCIIKYLEIHCAEEDSIIIWSDGCTYQNRNNILANALLSYAVAKNITIVQKFLVVGHTQMECDSVHSTIERKLKGTSIYLPSDYVRITIQARKNPFPYEVIRMSYKDFKNFEVTANQSYKSIRPGKVASDPTVNKLRVLKYSPDGIIYYKLNFDDDFQAMPQRRKVLESPIIWPLMSKEERLITKQKWTHLQQLKSVIPDDCHSFYDNIKHD